MCFTFRKIRCSIHGSCFYDSYIGMEYTKRHFDSNYSTMRVEIEMIKSSPRHSNWFRMVYDEGKNENQVMRFNIIRSSNFKCSYVNGNCKRDSLKSVEAHLYVVSSTTHAKLNLILQFSI